jgi:hypothetical protein
VVVVVGAVRTLYSHTSTSLSDQQAVPACRAEQALLTFGVLATQLQCNHGQMP